MAYDEKLASRVRATLGAKTEFEEIKMFGGLCFTVRGHMCCGVMNDELMLRVGADAYEDALGRPGARVMDFTGKPMKGMVIVEPKGVTNGRALRAWIQRGLAFVTSLPPKTPRRRPTKASLSTQERSRSGAAAASRPSGDAEAAIVGPFAGFGPRTFKFLRDLRAHNDKAWFDEHRDLYERDYAAPALAFIAAVGPRLHRLSRTISCVPKVNGSLFRIHRDVRFSKDKTPYRDHIDFWFWEGPKKGWRTPGFFLRIAPDQLTVGAGMHRLQKPQLDAFREAIVDGRAGKALDKHLAEATGAGFDVVAPTRKTVPRRYDPEHPRQHLLRHEGLTVTQQVAIPKEARSPAFVEWYADRCRTLLPVHRWLTKHVGCA